MLFKKKIDRALEANKRRMLEQKEVEYMEKGKDFNKEEFLEENKKIKLEKGDFLALLLAGYWVFAPIFLILILILILTYII